MRNKNNAKTFFLQLTNNIEQTFGFFFVKTGSRFVQNQDFRIYVDGTCNGYHLLNSYRIMVERFCYIYINI